MPRIRPYNSEIGVGGSPPTQQASPSDFGGTGLSEVGAQLGVLGERMQQQAEVDDVSNVRVKMAEARAQWETHFRDEAANSDPSDSNFSTKFKESFSDYLGKTREIAQTRKGQQTFDILAAEMGSQFSEKADTFQAAQAGQRAKINYTTTLNALGSAIVSDPTSYGQVKAQFNADMNDPNGIYSDKRIGKNARDELIIKGNEQLAQSYVNGLIDNGAPELARRLLIDGKLDSEISGDMKQTLIKASDVGINAKEQAAEREILLAKAAKQEAQEKVMDDSLARIIAPKENGGVLTDREILSNPVIDSKQKQHLIDYKMARARAAKADQEGRSNPAAVRALMLNIYSDTNNPNKVYNADAVMDAYKKGDISTNEMLGLRREVDALKDTGTRSFQQDVQSARSSIERAIGQSPQYIMQPDLVVAASARANIALEQKIEEYKKANKDPRTLLNPDNKDSPLNPSNLRTFITPAPQVLRDEAAKVVKDTRKSGGDKEGDESVSKSGKPIVFKNGAWVYK